MVFVMIISIVANYAFGNRPYQIVNDIVHGRRPITPTTALQLERVLALPARFWMIREADYRLKLARQNAA